MGKAHTYINSDSQTHTKYYKMEVNPNDNKNVQA
jgi:hypothetical protein